MKLEFSKFPNSSFYWPRAAMILALILLSTPLHAQSGGGSLDEEQIIKRAKDAVLKELRESDFLKKEIERGIQDYIGKQRQARETARAEKQRLANERAKKVRRVSSARDHIYGNRDAPISLIEYSDFECPFCKRFHPTAKKNRRVLWR